MIDPAAFQITAHRDAHDHRAFPCVVRAPPQQRRLVAQLHERGPDVIEELDFGYGLQTARGHPYGAADDVGFGQRGVIDAVAAEASLQIGRDLEDSAFAFDAAEIFGAAGVGHVLAEHDDARIAFQLFVQAAVDQIHHRAFSAVQTRLVFGVEFGRSRIDVGRIDVEYGRFFRRLGAAERAFGRVVYFGVGLVFDPLQLFFCQDALADEQVAEPLNRVSGRLVDALLLGTVERFVVRLRMRVRPDDVGVNQRGASAFAGVSDGAAESLVTGQKVGPVALLDVQARERRDQPRDAPAGGLDFHRDRDRVPVVFDQVQNRQL